MEVSVDESRCTFRLIRYADALTLEMRDSSTFDTYTWEGEPSLSDLREKLFEMAQRWLSQSIHRP
jgi:hypothetical protein